MVGEIRDRETADIAINASLTGHLVLSTIHTNNAIGIIPRLLDMGVEPYLIPPVLILGVAQRLVRTLCPGGGKRTTVEGGLKEMIEKEFSDVPPEYKKALPDFKEVYRLNPTPDCPAGTSGRVACFEVFDMTPELETAILSRKPEDELRAIVRAQGMLSMKEDAMIKSAQGIVPFEEVNTLGGEFEFKDVPEIAQPPAPEAISVDDAALAAAEKETPVVTKEVEI
jgi:type II secretory ATPase GspE/PulE/Tfp pilus assembly ATPase PilB-like protein